MIDGMIKGNGNSRYLKSALSSAATWEEFRDALIAGTLPVDLNGIQTDGWQQLGTPLNKASLLKEATAAKFGMDDEAVPDDVLNYIGDLIKVSAYTDTGTTPSTYSFRYAIQGAIVNLNYTIGYSGTGEITFTMSEAARDALYQIKTIYFPQGVSLDLSLYTTAFRTGCSDSLCPVTVRLEVMSAVGLVHFTPDTGIAGQYKGNVSFLADYGA